MTKIPSSEHNYKESIYKDLLYIKKSKHSTSSKPTSKAKSIISNKTNKVAYSVDTGVSTPKISVNSSQGKRSLDTLAQLATVGANRANEKGGECGCCGDFEVNSQVKSTDKKTLIKRARRNYMTTGLSLRLVDASKESATSILYQPYWNTYHCSEELIQRANGTITGSYCKNRWCLVCNSIRTARLIERYAPVINEWDDKRFVTLTRRNVSGDDLKKTIEEMQLAFTKIKNKYRGRVRRGTGEKFVGFRKLECTYNEITNRYHPHFHFIVKGEKAATELVEDWISFYKNDMYEREPVVNRKWQNNKAADDNSVKELFKYFTKVITKTKDSEAIIYADAMDVIFNAIRGKRTFQTFGFTAKEPEKKEEEEEAEHSEIERRWNWFQDVGDWVDMQNGDLLTNYKPTMKMEDLIRHKIIVRSHFNTS